MGLRLTGTYILQFSLHFQRNAVLSFWHFHSVSSKSCQHSSSKNHFQFTASMADSAKIKVTDPCAMAFPPLGFWLLSSTFLLITSVLLSLVPSLKSGSILCPDTYCNSKTLSWNSLFCLLWIYFSSARLSGVFHSDTGRLEQDIATVNSYSRQFRCIKFCIFSCIGLPSLHFCIRILLRGDL